MKLQYVQTVNVTKVLYAHQSMKTLLSVSRLVSKGATVGAIQDKVTIKKNGVRVILDAMKGQNKSTIICLKVNSFSPEEQE